VELTFLVSAIERHRADHEPAVCKLYELVKGRWDKRSKFERQWLVDNVAEFAGLEVVPSPPPHKRVEVANFEEGSEDFQKVQAALRNYRILRWFGWRN
jgi:hypothetical protein